MFPVSRSSNGKRKGKDDMPPHHNATVHAGGATPTPGWAVAALLVPTAEWVGLDVDEDDRAAWVREFESPTTPTVAPKPSGG